MAIFGTQLLKDAKVSQYKSLTMIEKFHFMIYVIFYWGRLWKNDYNMIFLVCMPGFSGINCREQCSYPAYGIRCKGYCDCKEDMCDMSIGCTTPTTGKFQHLHPFLLQTMGIKCSTVLGMLIKW